MTTTIKAGPLTLIVDANNGITITHDSGEEWLSWKRCDSRDETIAGAREMLEDIAERGREAQALLDAMRPANARARYLAACDAHGVAYLALQQAKDAEAEAEAEKDAAKRELDELEST